MSLFQSNLRKQIRKLPKILKSVNITLFNIIQYSFVSLDKTKICTPGAASGGTMTFMTPAWGGGAAPGTPSAILKAVLMAASCPCGAGCTSASRNLVGIRQHFLANFEGPANGSIATDFYETNNSFSQDFRNLQETCTILHCSKLVESTQFRQTSYCYCTFSLIS